MTRILVIKLGALGDFVQAFGAFAAIRAHHPGAHVTLLTTPAFAGLARRSPWFDAVHDHGRPDWRSPRRLWQLVRTLRTGGFARVYDLQTSARSSRYRSFVGGAVEWSGIARGASHPHANPERDRLHTADRQREQLAMAGISVFPAPALDWLDAEIASLQLPKEFALLIPGASLKRPGKRWPHFPALAAALDLPAVVVGVAAEAPLAAAIPGALDLTGRTDLFALAAVARRAVVAVGNDTGPTHLVAAVGCPTVALFGGDSDPALCAPRGGAVRVVRHLPLAGLPVATVVAAVGAPIIARSGTPGQPSSTQPPPGPAS